MLLGLREELLVYMGQLRLNKKVYLATILIGLASLEAPKLRPCVLKVWLSTKHLHLWLTLL